VLYARAIGSGLYQKIVDLCEMPVSLQCRQEATPRDDDGTGRRGIGISILLHSRTVVVQVPELHTLQNPRPNGVWLAKRWTTVRHWYVIYFRLQTLAAGKSALAPVDQQKKGRRRK